MNGPQSAWLPDGKRLHLHHGPIDLILETDAPHGYGAAVARFDTVLAELAAVLPALRQPAKPASAQRASVASILPQNMSIPDQMTHAVRPWASRFVTPMAAVAGAVADDMLTHIASGATRAYVNNGGDIALHLTHGQSFTLAAPTGLITLTQSCGIATSGWRGRSHSLGIADAVTVIAQTAAQADVAATLIANAVNLPGHPSITRLPAQDLAPDSDLGPRLVTTDVGPLSASEIARALAAGQATARDAQDNGLIHDAALLLAGQIVTTHRQRDLAHA